jgi:hypothetical protein
MSVGYLFSGVLGHLPLLAVLITGFVLIAGRRAWLGPRSVLLARLGLGALALGSVLQMVWTLLIPLLYSRLDYSATRYGLVISVFGLLTALISAAGVGLLIAALVTRSPGASYAGQPVGGGGYRGPPSDSGRPSDSGPPSEAGGRSAGAPPYAG